MTSSIASAHPVSTRLERGWLAEHWLGAFLILWGLWVWLPWTAPELMHLGLYGPGRVVYFIYSFFCHQLPQRSFFLFGPKPMYPLAAIQAAWQNTINPLVLRQFLWHSGHGLESCLVRSHDLVLRKHLALWSAVVVRAPQEQASAVVGICPLAHANRT